MNSKSFLALGSIILRYVKMLENSFCLDYRRAKGVPDGVNIRKQTGFIKGRLLGESKKRKFVRYQLMLDW